MITKFKFTHKAIENLPKNAMSAAAKCAEYSDTEAIGLKVLISKNGRKFFYARLTFNKRKYAIKLGEFPSLTVNEARQKVWQLRHDLMQGLDISRKHQAILSTPTFKQFVQSDYLPYATIHKRSVAADISKLRTHLLPRFGNQCIDEITLREIQLYHAQIKGSHCAATANRHLSLLSKIFNCAIEWGYLQKNPCKSIKKFPEHNTHERYLTSDEIKKLFVVMDQVKGNSIAIAAIKFLLLTGMRKNEALRGTWANVDIEQGTWFIPLTKNGKPHRVVLNEQAKALLSDLKQNSQSDFVFPSRNQTKPLCELRRSLNQLVQIAGIQPLRVHDLRHCFASICVQNGVPLLQVKSLLNHSNLSMTQRYAHLSNDDLVTATQVVSDVVTKALATQ
jgi:integrase